MKLGITAILLGIFLTAVGIIANVRKSKSEVGVVFLIGPIPIGFATSREALWTVLLITLLVLLMMLIYYLCLTNLWR